MRLIQRLTLGTRSIVLAGIMLLGSAAIPLAAGAHYMGWPGGHWTWNPTRWTLWLPVSRACAQNYWVAAGDAMNGWNASGTAVQFYEVGAYNGVCDGWEHNGRIDMYTFYDPNTTAWGYGTTYTLRTSCYFTSCYQYFDYSVSDEYDAGMVQLNTAKPTYSWWNPTTPTNYFTMVGDVTHELGHTLGLAHAGLYAGESSGYYSIMDYLNTNYNRPQAHDISDLMGLYPRWWW